MDKKLIKKSLKISIEGIKREIDWLKKLSKALETNEQKQNGLRLTIFNGVKDFPSACIISEEGKEELKELIEDEKRRRERVLQYTKNSIKWL